MESKSHFSTTLHNFYVQISRAVHGMTLVTDNKASLVKVIESNNGVKQAAIYNLSVSQLHNQMKRFQKISSETKDTIIKNHN